MDTHTYKDCRRKEFCRIVFSDSWRSFSQGDHFDTNNSDDISVIPGVPDMYYVQNLGYVPRGVVKEVQIVEKTITTTTSETFQVVDTMSFIA